MAQPGTISAAVVAKCDSVPVWNRFALSLQQSSWQYPEQKRALILWYSLFRSTCWRGCCPKLQRQTLYGKPWTPLRHRRLQARSEEHTSELQSRGHLVCRLLLEK